MSPVVRRRAFLAGAAGAAGVAGSLAGCTGDSDIGVSEVRLATGPAGAVYRRIGGGLAGLLRERLPGTAVDTVPSRASSDNIRMLQRGDVELGLANLDAALGDDGRPPTGIAALGRIYDSHFHLVVAADSPVRSVRDLDGLRVSYGARESGTDFTTRRLIALSGLSVQPRWLDQAESAQALTDGEVDAAFSLTGVPTPAITKLAREQPIRLVPMAKQAQRLAEEYPGPYIPATIPATAYEGVPACQTLAIPNVLLTRKDLPNDVVRIITETIFTKASTITDGIPEATQINVRTGIATAPIPLHPGAVAWFRKEKR